MIKSLFIIVIIVIIIIVGLLIYTNSSKKEISMPEKNLTGPEGKPLVSNGVNKKIVMVIAFRDFRDAEYFVPREILENAGIEIKTASTKKGIAVGADGGEVNVDLLVSEVRPAEFDAIIFIGGPAALKYLDNEDSYKLIRETVSQEKILASICISPVILAKAGVLEGKKATVWSSVMDKSAIKILEQNKAIYEDKSVVVDGKIITANGPSAAKEFGEKIKEFLRD